MSSKFAESLESSKQIWAILPDDDATIYKLLNALKDEKGILTAHQITCRGIGSVGRASAAGGFRKRPSKALRLLTLVVPETAADEVFDFVYERADVGKPMGGIVFMGALDGATAFILPDGVEDEA